MELNVVTVRFEALSAANLDSWLEIVTQTSRLASPYFHPLFAEACVRAGRNVQVSVVESNKGKAFFPFEAISSHRAGPLGGIMGDFHGVIARENHSLDLANLANLVGLSGLKTFEFHHLVCEGDAPPHSTPAISPVIDVSSGYDAYRESKVQQKSKLFKKIDKYKENLESKLGPLRFEHHSNDSELLDILVKLKSEQYLRSGIMDLFSFGWPLSLLSEILKLKEDSFKGNLSCLYAGDQAVFLHFGMQTKTRFHYWYPAYPTEYSSFSPGIVGLDYLIRAVARDQITAIDLGKGDNLYKSRFANAEMTVFEGEIVPSPMVKLKNNVIGKFTRTVKQSPLLHMALFPLRRLTRHYRQSRRYK